MIAWLVEAMIASTVLMLVVLALRGPVAARFGARAAYLLWLLPVLRLALPRLPHAPEPIKAMPIRFDFTHLANIQPTLPAPVEAVAATGPDWGLIAIALWLGGAAVFLFRELGRHRRFLHTALRRSDHGFMLGSVAVRRSRAVRGPLATGLIRRFILLPEDFARRYNAEEQRLALAHELAHHQRGDLFANLAALLVLSLHWFNPVAHRAYRAFRADQEKACDATVLNGRPHCAEAYGRALVKSARAPMRATACALGPAAELKERLTMIVRLSRSARSGRTGLALAGAVILSGLALTASGGIAATTPITALRPTPTALAMLAPAAPEAPRPPEAAQAPAAPEEPEAPDAWSAEDAA
ncbi:M56 family metallopeptidase, partial [Sphingomonas sp.]|uniref:M56 family metallopeptidase n=1 Tax=Sphingomonas sp. TaxID=28214 RepID=UPI003B3ADA2C